MDDDTGLCELMSRFLESEGFCVACAHDGESGLAKIRSGDFDLAVLDIMMPGKSGMDVLRELREDSTLPVIMLTARGEETDRIIGLELGADDYLPKPCNPRELAARIRAVLRRSAVHPDAGSVRKVQHIGSIEWHPHARKIVEHGREIELTTTEYNILAELMAHAGEVVSRHELSQIALGKHLGPFDRSLDMHVSHLRKKLSPLADGKARIKTVRGVGWLFVPE
ncbi:MAG: response regulator transcription factor [Mariprofundaceae bacterium]|nr:response regulator transcription factor [Mariprofundaceae bacterium]